jgi:hypothetical protein
MLNLNQSRIGHDVQADMQDGMRRMPVAQLSIAAGEASNSSRKDYDAERVVEELVCRYLRCSTTTSESFCF